MAKLPRFQSERLRKSENLAVNVGRQFDDLSSILGRYANVLERVDADSLASKKLLTDILPDILIGRNTAVNVRRTGAKGDGSDATLAFNRAIATGLDIIIPAGSYLISEALLPNSGQSIFMFPGVEIYQTASETNLFRIVEKEDVWIYGNGATLWGEGTYLGILSGTPWTGNSGHEDRGIQFRGCRNCGVRDVNLRNFGHAGIAIVGSHNIQAIVDVEGTHEHGTPLVTEDNFQMGAFLQNNANFGAVVLPSGTYDLRALKNIRVQMRVRGTAQGLVLEDNAFQAEGVDLDLLVDNIPGQHGAYIQSGGVTVRGDFKDTAYSAVKIQSGGNNPDIKGVNIDINARRTGSQAIELGVTASGSINDVTINLVGYSLQRGLAIAGKVRRVVATVDVEDVDQYALSISNGVNPDTGLVVSTGASDMDITVKGYDIGRDGVLVTATEARRLRIRPSIHNASTSAAGTYSGILVQSADAHVDLYDPDIKDDNQTTYAALFNDTAGSVVGLYGSVKLSGHGTYGIRTAQALSAFPHFYTIENTLTLSAVGYTNAVAGDIGKTVTGGTSGATGVLVSYDNTARKWLVRSTSTADFTTEAVTIGSGTGAGTVTAAAGKFHDTNLIFTPGVPYSTANPSVTVGLTAKNGTARTVMRSDAAPALDQNIEPTWTGFHQYNAGLAINGGSTGPGRLWKSSADGLVIQARSDGTDNGLALYSADNGTLFRNPTGTRDAYVGNGSASTYFPGLAGTGNRLVQAGANGLAAASIQILTGSATLDFGSIAAQATAELSITVTGAASGDRVIITPSGALEAGLMWGGYATTNAVVVRLGNITAGAIDPASRTWTAFVLK